MALSERTLSKLADVGAKADEAFQSGRVVWVEGPGMTWGGDADEVLALLVEKVEQQGWPFLQLAYDASGYAHVVFRRNEAFRALR